MGNRTGTWITRMLTLAGGACSILLSACGSAPSHAHNPPTPTSSAPAIASHPADPTAPTDLHALNTASFDQVWTTIRDQHFDPTLGGLDWNAVREELRPQAQAAPTAAATRAVLTQMLSRLKQSHFGIIPASSYGAVTGDEATRDEHDAAGDGESGIHLRVLDGEPVVVQVERDSAAERAGVMPGWILHTVDGKPLGPFLARIREATGPGIKFLTTAGFALERWVDRDEGQVIEAEFLAEDRKPTTLPITVSALRGAVTKFGNLPAMHVTFGQQRVPLKSAGSAGYVTFSIFLAPDVIMDRFTAAVASFADCKGIILDLRGNPGGIGGMAMGIAGHFVAKETTLGEMVTREGTLRFVANPRADAYAGKLAVLIDECSASTSEILAGGLQAAGRARVFGSPSAGQALPSTIAKLPNGDGFQYAFANFILSNGRTVEGAGITPDVSAPPTRSGLLAGEDAAFQAALAWIESAP